VLRRYVREGFRLFPERPKCSRNTFANIPPTPIVPDCSRNIPVPLTWTLSTCSHLLPTLSHTGTLFPPIRGTLSEGGLGTSATSRPLRRTLFTPRMAAGGGDGTYVVPPTPPEGRSGRGPRLPDSGPVPLTMWLDAEPAIWYRPDGEIRYSGF
jgi:hypothetical protein